MELFACDDVAVVGWIQYARRLLRFELLCGLFEDLHPLPFDGLVLCPQYPHAPRARQQEHALFVALLRLWENNNNAHTHTHTHRRVFSLQLSKREIQLSFLSKVPLGKYVQWESRAAGPLAASLPVECLDEIHVKRVCVVWKVIKFLGLSSLGLKEVEREFLILPQGLHSRRGHCCCSKRRSAS